MMFFHASQFVGRSGSNACGEGALGTLPRLARPTLSQSRANPTIVRVPAEESAATMMSSRDGDEPYLSPDNLDEAGPEPVMERAVLTNWAARLRQTLSFGAPKTVTN